MLEKIFEIDSNNKMTSLKRYLNQKIMTSLVNCKRKSISYANTLINSLQL